MASTQERHDETVPARLAQRDSSSRLGTKPLRSGALTIDQELAAASLRVQGTVQTDTLEHPKHDLSSLRKTSPIREHGKNEKKTTRNERVRFAVARG